VQAARAWAPGANALVWVDRQGREEALQAPPRGYTQVRLSPDGTRVALYVAGDTLDIWIWDLARRTLTRLTPGVGQSAEAIWTLDSRRVLFGSTRMGGRHDLFWQTADGSDTPEQLSKTALDETPSSLTPDGTRVVVEESGSHLMLLTLKSKTLTPLLRTSGDAVRGTVSPDGHWLAYESNGSGQAEVYVRPFPNVDAGQTQISTAGGMQPLWSRSGRELFFVEPDGSLFAVSVAARDGSWNASVPVKIVEHRYLTGPGSSGRNYDVSMDDRRFLMIRQAGAEPGAQPPQIMVVQNFQEELKQRGSAK